MEVAASMSIIGVMFLIFLGILWCLLPFAVFGIKDLAKTLIQEQRKTNLLLEKMSQGDAAKTESH